MAPVPSSEMTDSSDILQILKPPEPRHVGLSQNPSEPRVRSSNVPPSPTVVKLSPPMGQFVINTMMQIAAFTAAIAFGVFAVKSVTVANNANQYAALAVQQAETANQLAILAVCLSGANQNNDTAAICARVVGGASSVLPSAASKLFTQLPTQNPPNLSTKTSLSGPGQTSSTQGRTNTSTSTNVSTKIESATHTLLSATATASEFTSSGSGSVGSSNTFTSTYSSQPTSTSSPSAAAPSATIKAIVGGVVGGVVAILVLVALAGIFVRRQRRPLQRPPNPVSIGSMAMGGRPSAEKVETPPSPSHGHHDSNLNGGGLHERKNAESRFRKLFVDSYVVI